MNWELLRIISGLPFVFYLPGLAFTFIFWKKGEIDFIERSAFALLFSLVGVPLALFYFNLISKVKITPLNSFLIISLLISFFSLIGFWRKKRR